MTRKQWEAAGFVVRSYRINPRTREASDEKERRFVLQVDAEAYLAGLDLKPGYQADAFRGNQFGDVIACRNG